MNRKKNEDEKIMQNRTQGISKMLRTQIGMRDKNKQNATHFERPL